MPHGQRGWALLTMLLAALLVSISAATAQVAMRIEREREREAELLDVGRSVVAALGSYRAAAATTQPEWPRSLVELLEDKRTARTVRHLRRLPTDPTTGRAEWGLLREGDRIVGVHSLSSRPPLRRRNFPPEFAAFERANRLSDWHFTAYSTANSPPTSASEPAPANPALRNPAPAANPALRNPAPAANLPGPR
jgi:type II secretory pathway pseudopilin PulG